MEQDEKINLQKPGFWRKRVLWQIPLAYIIDFFLIGMLITGCLLVMFCALYNPNVSPDRIVRGTMWTILFLPIFYYGISETWAGTSPGKAAMNIAVKPRSFMKILTAYVLDFICVSLCSFISYKVFPNATLVVFIYLWLGIDFIIIEGITNASLGKWICGLRVRQLK